MKEQPLAFAEPESSEELERAEVYGLLARCWQAPPDEALLEQFAVAVTEAPQPGSFLEAPWQALVAAMRATTVAEAHEEYEALFFAIGKPEVLLYGSHYLSGSLNDEALVALRRELAAMGLGRDPANPETEDHVAYLLELMRYLIAGDDLAVCNLERQRLVFREHLQPWITDLCDAVQRHPQARLYACLAAFTRAFVEVETSAFDLIE